MSLIPYAGYDPSERPHWGWHSRPGPKKPIRNFVWDVMDAFDRGFDSVRIAQLLHATEPAVVKAIDQGREMRRY